MSRVTSATLWLLCLCAGCVSARPENPAIDAPGELVASQARFRKEYVWSAGDQLEVFVRGVPEVSRTIVVRPDGFISLPLLNDVRAAGLTPTELRDTLTRRFAERLLDPEVTVIAVQIPQPVVYVIGEVTNNAVIPLRSAPTAIQAITAAGGFRRQAKSSETMIIRVGEDGHIRAIPISTEAGGQPAAVMGARAMLLQPDDIIFVPESGRSQVARFLDDLVNRPLATLTGLAGLYFNFRLVEVISGG